MAQPLFYTRDPARFEAVCAIAGQLAHEYNNFLTALTAYPQLLKDTLPEPSEQREMLDVIEATAKQMAAITQQLMALSSGETRVPKPVDVNVAAQEAISRSKKDAEEKGITIERDFAADLPMAAGREDEIKLAVENLCRNAIEAMEKGGRLKIRTEEVRTDKRSSASGLTIGAGSNLKVSVADTGPGIDGRIRDSLFEPFVTTKKNETRRRAGLGLTVAFRIARDHAGAIDFASEPGKGATFSLYVPAESKGGTAAGEKKGEGISVIPCDRKRVLVVDDEKTILKLFQMILSAGLPDVKIDLAGNGQEALDQFVSGHHAVVLMDLHMPVMDGQVAFTRMEKFCGERNWEMPAVVFCTGFATPEMVSSIVAGNSKHHLLSKPVGGQTLVDAVKTRLEP